MAIYSKSQTEVEGLDELIKAFLNLGDDALVMLKDASDEAGKTVLEKAISKAPEGETKALKANLYLGKAKISKKFPFRIFSKVTYRGKKAGHTSRVELGHKIVVNGNSVGVAKEQPFLRPAADETEAYVIKKLSDAMSKAVDEMGGLK